MMRTLLIFLLLFTGCRPVWAQIMQPQWQQTLIRNYEGVANIKGVVQDGAGNIYTLAYVERGQVGTETVKYSNGPLYLIKTDKKGNLLQVSTLEVNTSGHTASLGIDDLGFVLIGGAFRYEIEWNGESLAYTNTDIFGKPNEEHGFLMKLNGKGKVLWFRDYPSSFGAYVNAIVADEDHNIYINISYNGRMLVNDVVLDSKTDANYCIVKLSQDGFPLWSNAKGSGEYPYAFPILKLYKPQQDCPQQLLVVRAKTDSFWEPYITAALTEYSPTGQEVRNFTLFTTTMGSVDDIATAGNKIYVGGNVYDTTIVAGTPLYVKGSATYLVQLNELLQPEKVQVLTRCAANYSGITSLKYMEGYGLVVAGQYADSFTLNNSTYRSSPYSYTPGINSSARGAFLLSLDKDLNLTDMQYADGDVCTIMNVFRQDEELSLAFWHNGYNPVTKDNYPNGFTIVGIGAFKKNDWKLYEEKANDTYIVYPAPFLSTCHVRFNTPVYGYRYNIYNAAGQLVINARVKNVNDTTVLVEMGGQAGGIYFLKMEDCCGRRILAKLPKL